METKRFEVKAEELRKGDVVVTDEASIEVSAPPARRTRRRVGNPVSVIVVEGLVVGEFVSGQRPYERLVLDAGQTVVAERQIQTAEERRNFLALGIRRQLWSYLEIFEARRVAFATDFEVNPVHSINWNAEPLSEAQILAEHADRIFNLEGRGKFDLFTSVAAVRKDCLRSVLTNAGQSRSSSTASNLVGEASLRAAAKFLDSYLLSEEALASVAETENA